jgi:nitrogen fixation protein NifU and related proteins
LADVQETPGKNSASSPDEPETSPDLVNRAMPHLDDLYREVVLDHYRRPRGHKEIVAPSISGEGFNPTCGDQVHVAVALDQDRIRDVQVQCQGCSISVASGSMMAELLVGRKAAEVEALTRAFKEMMHGHEPDPSLDLGDLVALEGVRQFPVRIKCALLAWTTLQEALRAFHDKEDSTDGTKEKGPHPGGGKG